jgi:hypothetical protein
LCLPGGRIAEGTAGPSTWSTGCQLCGLVCRGHHFKISMIHLCPLASRIAKSTAKSSPGSYPPGGEDHRGHFCRSPLFRWCPYGCQGCSGRSCNISMIHLCPFGGQSRQGHRYKSSRFHLRVDNDNHFASFFAKKWLQTIIVFCEKITRLTR